MWRSRNPPTLLTKMQNDTGPPNPENSLPASQKVKRATQPCTSTPRCLSKRNTAMCIHAKISLWILSAALFIVTQTQKQSKCPSTGEWINNRRCLRTMEYYSATRRNKPVTHATARTSLKTQSKSFFKTGGEQENSIFEYPYNICSEYLTWKK